MLIHDRFVFLHFQKTAGTFVADALLRELPEGSLRRGAPSKLHPGWKDLPSDTADRPVLVYVRNPWDWYVSWYHYVVTRKPESIVFRLLFANGANDFPTTLRIACRGGPEIEDAELAHLRSAGHRLTELFCEGHDFYTASFLPFLGAGLESNRLTIGRFEVLCDDLERFLDRAGVALPAGAMARIRAAEPLKATPHRPYREYYDDELRKLVRDSCRTLVDRFDYRF